MAANAKPLLHNDYIAHNHHSPVVYNNFNSKSRSKIQLTQWNQQQQQQIQQYQSQKHDEILHINEQNATSSAVNKKNYIPYPSFPVRLSTKCQRTQNIKETKRNQRLKQYGGSNNHQNSNQINNQNQINQNNQNSPDYYSSTKCESSSPALLQLVGNRFNIKK